MSTSPDNLLSLQTIADQLGVSLRSVYRLIHRGDLPPQSKVGARSARIPESDYRAYVERLKKLRGPSCALESKE